MFISKKVSKLIVFLTILALFVVSGCSGTSTGDKTGENKDQPKTATYNISMSLGGTSGTYYVHGAALADIINQKSTTIKVIPTTSGGGADNLVRVGKNEAQLGMVVPTNVIEAWQGIGNFQKNNDIRFVGPCEKPIGIQVVTLKKSGLTTLEDLIGKKVVLGQIGSISRTIVEPIFKERGIEVKEINVTATEAPDKLLIGDIDAYCTLNTLPVARVSEIASTEPVTIIDLGKDLEAIKYWEKNPFMSKMTIPTGVYNGVDKDGETVGIATIFITHKDIPEEVIYEFMKWTYDPEVVKQLENTFRNHDQLSETPLDGMIIPIHPGAEKYWKEKGFTIPTPAFQ